MFQKPQARQTDEQSLQAGLMTGVASAVERDAKGRGRLLVAEDARCIQSVVRSILGNMHLEADVVENGQKACELAEKSKAKGNPYDLILMDMQMPVMNGHEAVRWLRDHGWQGPIVAVTAHGSAEDRKKCLDAGCNDHVPKPITEVALRDVVTRHLDGTAVIPC